MPLPSPRPPAFSAAPAEDTVNGWLSTLSPARRAEYIREVRRLRDLQRQQALTPPTLSNRPSPADFDAELTESVYANNPRLRQVEDLGNTLVGLAGVAAGVPRLMGRNPAPLRRDPNNISDVARGVRVRPSTATETVDAEVTSRAASTRETGQRYFNRTRLLPQGLTGTTPLYRADPTGEPRQYGPRPAPVGWAQESPEVQARSDAAGRWFFSDRALAEQYLNFDLAPGAKPRTMMRVDVPTRELESYRVSNSKHPAKADSKDPRNEFLVPHTYALDARRETSFPDTWGMKPPVYPDQPTSTDAAHMAARAGLVGLYEENLRVARAGIPTSPGNPDAAGRSVMPNPNAPVPTTQARISDDIAARTVESGGIQERGPGGEIRYRASLPPNPADRRAWSLNTQEGVQGAPLGDLSLQMNLSGPPGARVPLRSNSELADPLDPGGRRFVPEDLPRRRFPDEPPKSAFPYAVEPIDDRATPAKQAWAEDYVARNPSPEQPFSGRRMLSPQEILDAAAAAHGKKASTYAPPDDHFSDAEYVAINNARELERAGRWHEVDKATKDLVFRHDRAQQLYEEHQATLAEYARVGGYRNTSDGRIIPSSQSTMGSGQLGEAIGGQATSSSAAARASYEDLRKRLDGAAYVPLGTSPDTKPHKEAAARVANRDAERARRQALAAGELHPDGTTDWDGAHQRWERLVRVAEGKELNPTTGRPYRLGDRYKKLWDHYQALETERAKADAKYSSEDEAGRQGDEALTAYTSAAHAALTDFIDATMGPEAQLFTSPARPLQGQRGVLTATNQHFGSMAEPGVADIEPRNLLNRPSYEPPNDRGQARLSANDFEGTRGVDYNVAPRSGAGTVLSDGRVNTPGAPDTRDRSLPAKHLPPKSGSTTGEYLWPLNSSDAQEAINPTGRSRVLRANDRVPKHAESGVWSYLHRAYNLDPPRITDARGRIVPNTELTVRGLTDLLTKALGTTPHAHEQAAREALRLINGGRPKGYAAIEFTDDRRQPMLFGTDRSAVDPGRAQARRALNARRHFAAIRSRVDLGADFPTDKPGAIGISLGTNENQDFEAIAATAARAPKGSRIVLIGFPTKHEGQVDYRELVSERIAAINPDVEVELRDIPFTKGLNSATINLHKQRWLDAPEPYIKDWDKPGQARPVDTGRRKLRQTVEEMLDKDSWRAEDTAELYSDLDHLIIRDADMGWLGTKNKRHLGPRKISVIKDLPAKKAEITTPKPNSRTGAGTGEGIIVSD